MLQNLFFRIIMSLNNSTPSQASFKRSALTPSGSADVGRQLVVPQYSCNYSMSYASARYPSFHAGVNAEGGFPRNGFVLERTNPACFNYVPDEQINSKLILVQLRLANVRGAIFFKIDRESKRRSMCYWPLATNFKINV